MYEQKIDGDKNNPRISRTTVTNVQWTLASAKENFPILNDLLGPVEPETFFLAPFFFQQINMVLSDRSQQQKFATNKHSVVYETLINGAYPSAN